MGSQFPYQGSSPCTLHWQRSLNPLDHQRSPRLWHSGSSRQGPSPRPRPSRRRQDRPWACRGTYSPEGRQAHQPPRERLPHCRHFHPASTAAASEESHVTTDGTAGKAPPTGRGLWSSVVTSCAGPAPSLFQFSVPSRQFP